MTSPTARSLTLLRSSGYAAAVVERWIPGANIRKDLFGCIDLVAVGPGTAGVLGIQATSRANVSARLAKAQRQAELRLWLASGNTFEVWGWHQVSGRWTVHRVAVQGEDLEPVPLTRGRRGRKARQGELFDG